MADIRTWLIEHPGAVVTAVALMIGAAVALVAGVLAGAAAEVPPEDRQFKDPPPPILRMVWPPVNWIAHYLSGLISDRRRDAIKTSLRKAGLDYAVTPEQFVAARIVFGLLFGSFVVWIVNSFATVRGTPISLLVRLEVFVVGALLGWIWLATWVRDRIAARRRELLKALPFLLDIITLCVEAGLNMQGAMNQAVAKGPKGVLRDEFQRVLRDLRAGKPRADAMRAMADRINEPSVSRFVSAVIQAENMGMNLGPVLRAQAEQRRTERFLRAEKLAMEAPVKMLFPLIAFIFPCTFIVLFFPLVMKFMNSGF